MGKRKRMAAVLENLELRQLLSTVVVTNLSSSGSGSLSDAVTHASAGDVIDCTGIQGTIQDAHLAIQTDVTIVGPGADKLTLAGIPDSTVVLNYPGSTTTISGLTITQMDGGDGSGMSIGGGIFNYNTSTLTLDHVNVTGCTSGGSEMDGLGGGIFNQGVMAMTDCAVTNNHAIAIGGEDPSSLEARGGGIFSYVGATLSMTGCLVANNTAISTVPVGGQTEDAMSFGGGLISYNPSNTFINCTFANNSATVVSTQPGEDEFDLARGGGIYLANPATFMNCTISGNSADGGQMGTSWSGGVYLSGDATTITNCIIAGNTAKYDPDLNGGTGQNITDGGNNLIGVMTENPTVFSTDNGDIVGNTVSPADAMLGMLADNGGPTETMGLLDGSPAIDAGTSTGAPTTDARGLARNGAVDIGAFESVIVNAASVFSSTGLTSATSGTQYEYDITTTDADGDDRTITSVNSLPSWLTLTDNGDGTATLIGMPTNSDAGHVSVKLRVNDGHVNTDQSFTLDVSAVNHKPALAPITFPDAVAGVMYSQTIYGTDPDSDPISILPVSKPAWMTITDNDNGTATVSGIPTFDVGGANAFSVKANDGSLDSDNSSYSVNVSMLRWAVVGTDLTITGSNDDDTISVQQRAGQFRIIRNGVTKNIPDSGITNVDVYGFDGNDNVSLNLKSAVGYVLGGAGNDSIAGGDEDDILTGGGGKDRLYGNGGNDAIRGLAGNDTIDGGAGDDRLLGGDDNDVLIGGTGVDLIHGEGGDDFIYARDNKADHIFGDDGNNSAQVDSLDVQGDVFTLIS